MGTECPAIAPSRRRGPWDGVLATTCSGIPGASGAPLVDAGEPPTVLGMVVANHKRAGIALSAAHIRRLLGLW